MSAESIRAFISELDELDDPEEHERAISRHDCATRADALKDVRVWALAQRDALAPIARATAVNMGSYSAFAEMVLKLDELIAEAEQQ